MRIRFRAIDGGIVITHINARNLDKYRAQHPTLEVLTWEGFQ